MLAIKGFITNAVFIDNAVTNGVGKTATIGEISKNSLTFSRESGTYSSGNAPDLTLVTLLSAKDGVLQPVAGAVAEQILAVSKHIYDKTLGSSQQVYADEMFNELIALFAGKAESFSGGAMVTDGHYWVPEWVSWKNVEDPTLGDNEIRVWFVEDSLKEQYDEFEIVVVPPFDNLDDFFKTGTEVGALLTALDDSARLLRLQNAKDGHPETIIRSIAYNYIDPYNAAHKVPANWGLLIYGPGGNNVDAISDKLVDYILANSTHTRAEWTKILPDIFKRTEVIIVPIWNQYAIPNKQTQEGMYSQLDTLAGSIAFFKSVIPSYPGSLIEAFATKMGNPYKGLAILAVGGPDNRDNLHTLRDIFPDYVPLPTGQDFNRMQEPTRGFALMLQEMLLWTERMTPHSSIPTQSGYTRTIRDGVLYMVKNYQNINYLVAAKSNFPVA